MVHHLQALGTGHVEGPHRHVLGHDALLTAALGRDGRALALLEQADGEGHQKTRETLSPSSEMATSWSSQDPGRSVILKRPTDVEVSGHQVELGDQFVDGHVVSIPFGTVCSGQ
jgi:hypothetical protein